MHSTRNDLTPVNLPDFILPLDNSIRFCAVIDVLGNIVGTKRRNNVLQLMPDKEIERQALMTAIRYFKRQSWESYLGDVYYWVTRYEKAIGAVLPLSQEYLLILAFDVNADNFDTIIMKKVRKLIQQYQPRNSVA